MLTENVVSLPRSFNVERFMEDFLLDTIHQADGQNFAAEFDHGDFACLDVECRRERCVALQERVLALRPDRFTRCAVCGCTVSNIARLDCNGGCAS